MDTDNNNAAAVETDALEVRVSCRDDEQSCSEPQCFYIGGRRVGVVDVLDRWPASDCGYFKLRCDDGGVYILRYDEGSGCWGIAMFDSGVQTQTQLSST
jgi:hypothetical protein